MGHRPGSERNPPVGGLRDVMASPPDAATPSGLPTALPCARRHTALKDKQARAKDSWHLFGGLVGRKTTPDSATLEDQPRRTCFLTEPAEVSERSERQRVRSPARRF